MIAGFVLIIAALLLIVYPPLLSIIVAAFLLLAGIALISISRQNRLLKKHYDNRTIEIIMR